MPFFSFSLITEESASIDAVEDIFIDLLKPQCSKSPDQSVDIKHLTSCSNASQLVSDIGTFYIICDEDNSHVLNRIKVKQEKEEVFLESLTRFSIPLNHNMNSKFLLSFVKEFDSNNHKLDRSTLFLDSTLKSNLLGSCDSNILLTLCHDGMVFKLMMAENSLKLLCDLREPIYALKSLSVRKVKYKQKKIFYENIVSSKIEKEIKFIETCLMPYNCLCIIGRLGKLLLAINKFDDRNKVDYFYNQIVPDLKACTISDDYIVVSNGDHIFIYQVVLKARHIGEYNHKNMPKIKNYLLLPDINLVKILNIPYIESLELCVKDSTELCAINNKYSVMVIKFDLINQTFKMIDKDRASKLHEQASNSQDKIVGNVDEKMEIEMQNDNKLGDVNQTQRDNYNISEMVKSLEKLKLELDSFKIKNSIANGILSELKIITAFFHRIKISRNENKELPLDITIRHSTILEQSQKKLLFSFVVKNCCDIPITNGWILTITSFKKDQYEIVNDLRSALCNSENFIIPHLNGNNSCQFNFLVEEKRCGYCGIVFDIYLTYNLLKLIRPLLNAHEESESPSTNQIHESEKTTRQISNLLDQVRPFSIYVKTCQKNIFECCQVKSFNFQSNILNENRSAIGMLNKFQTLSLKRQILQHKNFQLIYSLNHPRLQFLKSNIKYTKENTKLSALIFEYVFGFKNIEERFNSKFVTIEYLDQTTLDIELKEVNQETVTLQLSSQNLGLLVGCYMTISSKFMVRNNLFKVMFNQFRANVSIFYLLKTPENERFSGVFRRYKIGTFAKCHVKCRKIHRKRPAASLKRDFMAVAIL